MSSGKEGFMEKVKKQEKTLAEWYPYDRDTVLVPIDVVQKALEDFIVLPKEQVKLERDKLLAFQRLITKNWIVPSKSHFYGEEYLDLKGSSSKGLYPSCIVPEDLLGKVVTIIPDEHFIEKLITEDVERIRKEYSEAMRQQGATMLARIEFLEKLDDDRKQKLQPHKIICLVGTTKPEFQEQYRKVNRELCLAGYLVVTVSLFKNDVADIEKYRDLLESIHFQKIRLSDAVVLIHKDAIGTYTKMELEYCRKIEKPIVVFNNIEQTDRELRELFVEGEG